MKGPAGVVATGFSPGLSPDCGEASRPGQVFLCEILLTAGMTLAFPQQRLLGGSPVPSCRPRFKRYRKGLAVRHRAWAQRQRALRERSMSQPDACRMICRRAVAAGIAEAIGCPYLPSDRHYRLSCEWREARARAGNGGGGATRALAPPSSTTGRKKSYSGRAKKGSDYETLADEIIRGEARLTGRAGRALASARSHEGLDTPSELIICGATALHLSRSQPYRFDAGVSGMVVSTRAFCSSGGLGAIASPAARFLSANAPAVAGS